MNLFYIQWNLSNPTHQGTREIVGILEVLFMLTELLWDDQFLLDVTGCRIAQVPLYIDC
jgi:hypothetical protein